MLGKIIPAVTLAAGAAAAAGAAVMKKKNICPICEVKKAMKRADGLVELEYFSQQNRRKPDFGNRRGYAKIRTFGSGVQLCQFR